MFDTSAGKKNTTVTVNEDLLRQARAIGLNLSRTLEERLVELVAEHRRRAWLEENHDALTDYNARVEAEGSFGDDERRF